MAPHQKEKFDSTVNECDRKDLEKSDLEEKQDKYHIIYVIFFLLGLVHFLPWSFFSTATEFWMYKFRNTTSNETKSEFRTDLQASFNAALKINLQITEIAFLILSMIFGRYVRVRTRMTGLLTVILVLFIAVAVFAKIDTDSWQQEFFILIMAITCGINAMNALFTITMYSIMSNFPREYLAPYLTGGGLSGIFTAVLQILSLTLGLSLIDSALVYFWMGVFVIAFTLIAFILTTNNEYYRYRMKDFKEGQKQKMITFKEGYRLLKKTWTSVFIMGMFLLSVDASPTALVVSEGEGNGPWNDVYFIPTITFLLAAICDIIGRGLAFRFTTNITPVSWVLITVIRTIIFIPLFMFCNAQPRHHLPVLFPHDYQYIIMIIMSSLTGGYLLSKSSYNISALVSKDELQHAYHVNMLAMGTQMAVLSFVSMVSVKLL